MSVNITEIVPDVFIQLEANVGCPKSKVEHAIVIAVRRLCFKTLCWFKTLDKISIVAGTQGYALSSTDGDIISVNTVKYKQDGLDDDRFTQVSPTTEIYKDTNSLGGWNFVTGQIPNEYYISNGGTQINLLPIPTVASDEGLLVKVYIRPLLTATAIEDFIYNKYRDVIVNGAISKLLKENGTPWTNIEVGLLKEREFRSQCDDIIGENTKGYTNRPLSVRFRRQV